jgi:hypothetical protein
MYSNLNAIVYDLACKIENFTICILLKICKPIDVVYLFYRSDAYSNFVVYDNIFSKYCDQSSDIRFRSYSCLHNALNKLYYIY